MMGNRKRKSLLTWAIFSDALIINLNNRWLISPANLVFGYFILFLIGIFNNKKAILSCYNWIVYKEILYSEAIKSVKVPFSGNETPY